MDFKLKTAVWEITNACNMRCGHCGSSSGEPRSDELTTQEALDLCDQLAKLGVEQVTLSGGEPFVRADWHLIAKRLSGQGVIVNVISNGWMLDEQVIQTVIDSGMCNIGISIDGMEETHDSIRRRGSFSRIMAALDTMREKGLPSAVVSCLNRKNMRDLPALKDLLVDKGVERWQLQLAEPMGNMLHHIDILLRPEEIAGIVDFAYDTAKEGKIQVDIADNIGYYDEKISDIRRVCSGDRDDSGTWQGCQAGKNLIGIRCNGDISACLSIRDDSYIEGNIREAPLAEIWSRAGAFSWNRKDRRDDLTGFCAICHYADLCGAGCTGSRLTLSQSSTENRYCIYRVEMQQEEREVVKGINTAAELMKAARRYINDEHYEVADACLQKVLNIDPADVDALDMLGFTKYKMGLYEECRRINELSLKRSPDNAYAHKGLGMALAKLNRVEEGIEHLQRSVDLTADNHQDYLYDLALVLHECGRTDEAIEVLEEAKMGRRALDNDMNQLLSELKDKKKSSE